MAKDLSKTIIELLEGTSKNLKAQPLNLGGFGGGAGGIGGPPGGYIGWLPQTRVAYDEVEAATLATNPSGFNPPSGWSLVDNLNHIRYRLDQLEVSSGILVVDEIDGSPSVSDVYRLSFSGALVTDLGGGHALVTISGVAGSGGGFTEAQLNTMYLRLDASNDPVTGQLVVDVDNLAGSSEAALTVLLDDTDTFGYGAYVESLNNVAAYLVVHNSNDALFIDQIFDTSGTKAGAALYISRYKSGAITAVQTQHAIIVSDDITGVTYSGGTLKHTYEYTRTIADINPYAPPAGTMVLFDSVQAINNTGRLLSLENQEIERFYVIGSGIWGTKNNAVGVVPTPAAGYLNLYGDSTRKGLASIDDTGAVRNYSTIFLSFITYDTLPAGITGVGVNPFVGSVNRTYNLVEWSQSCLVSGTNDGSNYWVLNLLRLSDGATINTINTSAISAGAWTLIQDSTFSITSIGTSGAGLYINITKVGAPGSLSLGFPLIEAY
jgi:hypothetical protein